jgi:hypothetical protein
MQTSGAGQGAIVGTARLVMARAITAGMRAWSGASDQLSSFAGWMNLGGRRLAVRGALAAVVIVAGAIAFRATGRLDRPARASTTAIAAPTPSVAGRESPAPDPRSDELPDEGLPPLTPEPGGTAPGRVAPDRVAPEGRAPADPARRHRHPTRVAPPQDEPEPAPIGHADPIESSKGAGSHAVILPEVTFESLHLVTRFNDDNEPEEADAHLVLHSDRFTVVDDDAERVAHEIVFGSAPSRSEQAVLTGTVRLLNGSEMYLILPASTGRVVLRVDRDDAMRLAHEIELRVHKPVNWSLGELTRGR